MINLKSGLNINFALLAGGASSRFAPFNSRSKTIFRLTGKPILEQTLNSLQKMGIKETVLVSPGGTDFPDIGGNLSFKVRKVIQSEPRGQADALLTAWKGLDQAFSTVVLNAQHFTAGKYIHELIKKYRETGDSVVGAAETEKPWNYGIIQTKGDRVISVAEKPAKGKELSNLRIVGIYLLTPEAIGRIASFPLSDYQLEAGLDELAKNGKLRFVKLDGEFPSLKYSWDLLDIKNILLDGKRHVDKTAFVHPTALIEGPVWVGPKTVVGAYCVLRKGVCLEKGAQLERFVDAKNLIVGENSHIHSGFLGDSVIGENCRIGAGFVTANRRFDRLNVSAVIKGKKVDTGTSFLGSMIGNEVNIGIQSATMPGTIIKSGSVVMPGTIVRGTAEGKIGNKELIK